jgi:predicted ATPase
MMVPLWLSYLSIAYADIGQLDLAWHSIEEALTMAQATGERWIEAEVHRTAGEVALVGSTRDAAKAEAFFERALVAARQQQAKSWELRASMSLAGLWRAQGKVQQARELLAPVYGWFTEGFETRDLQEAKALLEELAA